MISALQKAIQAKSEVTLFAEHVSYNASVTRFVGIIHEDDGTFLSVEITHQADLLNGMGYIQINKSNISMWYINSEVGRV